MNQEMIDGIVARERERPFPDEPYLIQPEEKPIDYRGEAPYRRGDLAALPSVGCVGRFLSYAPARDVGRQFSELVVIWFQDQFALPIDPKVWPSLVAIDWDRHAADGDW
jgi:hypothetical protein